MKSLVITRGNFELSRAVLNKSTLVVGRSPSCDLVVRAPGVEAVHFLVEWEGSGNFDPAKGHWTISDVSKSKSGNVRGKGQSLSTKHNEIDGFNFALEDASYASAALLGGEIIREVSAGEATSDEGLDNKLLEIIWFRSHTGAVEDVAHLSPRSIGKVAAPFARMPGLKVQLTASASTQLFLKDLKDAQLLRRGKPVATDDAELKLNDFLELNWKNETFFLRFVSKIKSPPIEKKKLDKMLINMSILSTLAFSLLIFTSFFAAPNLPEVVAEPPRVARVEVSEIVYKPVIDPIVKEAAPIPTKLNLKELKQTKEIQAGLKHIEVNSKAAQVAKPRVKAEEGRVRMGLNSPAKTEDINQVGILGMLKLNRAQKGAGVKADLIINQGIQTQALIARGTAGVVIKNPPAGVIGTGDSGDPRGSKKGLENISAATTLRSRAATDPTSLGAIARKGGVASMELGTSLKGQGGKGAGRGMDAGIFDTGDLSVIGGLDKETVRRVIAGYRGKVRICYDKSLVGNPKVAGRVVYKWLISPPGPVPQVNITKSGVESQTLEQCVLGVIKNMVFPKAPNGRPTTVIYPFEFFSKN
jgi:hypothetical protein